MELHNLVTLTEIVSNTRGRLVNGVQEYSLREVDLNPSQIVCLREDENLNNYFQRNSEMFPSGLHEGIRFTRINLDRGQLGIDITVVGSMREIRQKLSEHSTDTSVERLHHMKKLLKG